MAIKALKRLLVAILMVGSGAVLSVSTQAGASDENIKDPCLDIVSADAASAIYEKVFDNVGTTTTHRYATVKAVLASSCTATSLDPAAYTLYASLPGSGDASERQASVTAASIEGAPGAWSVVFRIDLGVNVTGVVSGVSGDYPEKLNVYATTTNSRGALIDVAPDTKDACIELVNGNGCGGGGTLTFFK